MSDETTPQDDAAMSPASAGSVDAPVAWAVVYPNDAVAVIAFKMRDADEMASASDRVVPLYRQPTLTEAEREAVAWYAAYGAGDHASTLRSLLSRLSPPVT